MRRIFLAMAVVALLACATARLSNEVKAYVGQDIHELIKHLGSPTGKRESAVDRVYVWSVDSEGVLPSRPGAGDTSTSIMTVQHECTLEVTVNVENIVQSYQVEGSDAGCAAFRSHLRH